MYLDETIDKKPLDRVKNLPARRNPSPLMK